MQNGAQIIIFVKDFFYSAILTLGYQIHNSSNKYNNHFLSNYTYLLKHTKHLNFLIHSKLLPSVQVGFTCNKILKGFPYASPS